MEARRVGPPGPAGTAGGHAASAHPHMWRMGAPAWVNGALLNLAAVAALSAAFAPFDIWPLAYVALVPWVLAAAGEGRARRAVLMAGAAGLVFWAGNLYWLTWVTLEGYAGLVVYLTLYWAAGAAVVRAGVRRGWPAWLVLPVTWTALEYLRAWLISGFPWYFLAHTQYAQAAVIQVADATGQYGVTFLVAMVNGAAADVLRWRLVRRPGGDGRPRFPTRGLAATAAVAGAVLGYGFWRLGQAPAGGEGLVVGLVQEAVPNRLGEEGPSMEEVFLRYWRGSVKFVRERCDLVVWSEAVLRGVNEDFLAASGPQRRAALARYYWTDKLAGVSEAAVEKKWGELTAEKRWQLEALGKLGGAIGCPVLAGAGAIHYDAASGEWQEFNATQVFEGGKVTAEYDKIHPVPFSEYIPFRRSWPWLYRVLRSLVPEVMSPLEPGREVVRFEVRGAGGKRWRAATPICYEGTFPQVCRRMVYENGGKRADLLVNVSNDGWFVLPGAGARPSTEHAQHLSHYSFRAVENRVPVLRAANTGISASIDSSGRIVASMGYRPGALAVKALADARVSLYSIVGDAFATVVSAAGVAMVAWWIWTARKQRRVAP